MKKYKGWAKSKFECIRKIMGMGYKRTIGWETKIMGFKLIVEYNW